MNNSVMIQILVDAPGHSLGEDNCLDVSDSTLDLIWTHIVETTDNRGMLMSDVVNGDELLDDLLILFASTGGTLIGANLRARSLQLFRTWAHDRAIELESDVRDVVVFGDHSDN